MKTVEELAKEYAEGTAWKPEGKSGAYYGFINGYNKAKEWLEFTDKTLLPEGRYLCMWEGAKPEWTEVKLLNWTVDPSGGCWLTESGDHDENVTHYKYTD